jgi:hypothetical protein
MSRKYEVEIPHLYLELTKGYSTRGTMFKRYVMCYVERNYPKLKFNKIEVMKALCEKKGSGEHEEWEES